MGTPTRWTRLGRRITESALPARRLLSRAALVYEERHFRDVAVNAVYATLTGEAKRLRGELKSLEERAIIRVDTLMEELWRRMEGVGARQATEIQRLTARLNELEARTDGQLPEIERVTAQLMEAQKLAAEVAAIRAGAGSTSSSPWDAWLGLVDGGAVVALGPQAWSLLDAARGAGLAVTVVEGDAAAYLQNLPPSSLGAALCGTIAPDAMAGLAAALQPGGVAIVDVGDGARAALMAAAEAAGLQIPGGDAAWASRPLPPVQLELADPSLQEIAHGVNGLIAELNGAGSAPHGFLARRPA